MEKAPQYFDHFYLKNAKILRGLSAKIQEIVQQMNGGNYLFVFLL
jgi:hypothetical protein